MREDGRTDWSILGPWGSRGRRFKSCHPDQRLRRSEAITARAVVAFSYLEASVGRGRGWTQFDNGGPVGSGFRWVSKVLRKRAYLDLAIQCGRVERANGLRTVDS